MCIICIDFQKEKMTLGDARRALGEMAETLDEEHLDEVEEMLDEAERHQTQDDDPTDDS